MQPGRGDMARCRKSLPPPRPPPRPPRPPPRPPRLFRPLRPGFVLLVRIRILGILGCKLPEEDLGKYS